MATKNSIALSPQERQEIEIVSRSYRHSQRERSRSRILLLADENQPEGARTNRQIAEVMQCPLRHVEKIRQKAIERGAVESLKHKAQERRKERKLDGAAEAKLTSVACSQAPDGRNRWTLQMLADQLIQMEVVDFVSDTTIYWTMKKTRSSRG